MNKILIDMKIKDLDPKEVYGLEEIKKDSLKFNLLMDWLEKNCHKWDTGKSDRLFDYKTLKYEDNRWYMFNGKPTKCALTLFDLDITDYQVDCSELSKEQIEEMAEVVKSRGFVLWDNENVLSPTDSYKYFKYNDNEGFFIVCKKVDSKTTITYDKFIDLFGEKPNEWIQSDFGQYKLTEQGLVFHDDFDLELYKELGGLSNKEPIEQTKPSQYQIGIDTFTRAESNMTKDEILACVRFNIDKYNWRKKDQDRQDLEKIISYAQWGLKQFKD